MKIIKNEKLIKRNGKIGNWISIAALIVLGGGMLIRPAMGGVRKFLDPSEYGAATLLGVNGLVFIGHGRSDARAVQVAVRVAKEACEANLLGAMKSAIEESLKK